MLREEFRDFFFVFLEEVRNVAEGFDGDGFVIPCPFAPAGAAVEKELPVFDSDAVKGVVIIAVQARLKKDGRTGFDIGGVKRLNGIVLEDGDDIRNEFRSDSDDLFHCLFFLDDFQFGVPYFGIGRPVDFLYAGEAGFRIVLCYAEDTVKDGLPFLGFIVLDAGIVPFDFLSDLDLWWQSVLGPDNPGVDLITVPEVNRGIRDDGSPEIDRQGEVFLDGNELVKVGVRMATEI